MQFWLNGELSEYHDDPDLPLLTYLRDVKGITSPKDGCAPQAACGCCAVQVGDKALLSCVTKMSKVEGEHVITTEGLDAYRQEVYANAFATSGGVQCGFCIPGIVMQSHVLISTHPEPTREDIEKALTPHLCRCTGYKKIVDAVQLAATTVASEKELPLPESDGRIGTRHPKYQAGKLVMGQHQYIDDIRMAGMVYGAIRFSDHPRAKILRIEPSKAQSHPGVIRVIMADDVPGARFQGLIEHDWPLFLAEGEITRYIGDALALVVAESDHLAREAARLIEVEYEVLEPITDMHEALNEHSPTVHGNDTNILARTAFRRGAMEEAEKQTAFTASGVFQTQRIEHGFMEPECSIAYPGEDGRIEVLSQGQGVYEDRIQLASLLGVEEDQVRVIMVPNGGGFGGKEDLSVQGHAAVAAHHLQVPVKVRLTRDESIAFHPKRHPIWMDYRIGCDADGKMTFCKVQFIGDTGAYASVGAKVLERSAGHATGAYHFPAVDVESTAVYTNNIPCGAMRGFGVNQAIFGLESLIDDLCEQGGFDRWQVRYDNALDTGDMTATGQVLEGGVGIKATLLAVKDQFYDARYAGIACGLKNTGIGNGIPDASAARITVAAPDKIILDHGWTEMGQGVNTVAVQVFCNETGIAPEFVEVHIDTASGQAAGMTTASRATSLVGNALINACKGLCKDLETHSLDQLVGKQYEAEWVVDWTTKPGKVVDEIKTHYSYSYATQLVTLDEDGQIQKITAAHDAGKIFNPTLFEGQLEGSLHMGLGYAISEDLPMEGGRLKSTMLRKCGILRAKEMPELEVIGIEEPDPHGPYGAKGVGEIGLVPTAAAVANALYQFDGIRRTNLPMSMPKHPVRRGS